MSKIDQDKFIEYLKGKWGDTKCPMCQAEAFQIQDRVFQLIEFSNGGLTVGGPVVPIIPVSCSNCGNTILVNAIQAGQLDVSKGGGDE